MINARKYLYALALASLEEVEARVLQLKEEGYSDVHCYRTSEYWESIGATRAEWYIFFEEGEGLAPDN